MSLLVDIKKKLKEFTLEIDFKTDGESLGILGASGSGKSMTLKCIAGVETPDEGRIVLNGKTLFDSRKGINLKPQDRNIGYLFQSYALFPHMTVEENIGIGLNLHKTEKELRIREIIESFHLEGLESKYPNKLSGGQQQRVALARCLVYKPDALMLDEPFSALDSHLKDHLQSEVLELLKSYDGEILMVSHNKEEVYRFCKKLTIFDKGKSILLGETKDIFKNPKLQAAARLTGCKNISGCELLSSNTIYASKWGITLETNQGLTQGIGSIGILEQELQIVNSVDEKDINVIQCRVNKIIEDTSQYSIFLEANKGESFEGNGEIIYRVNKEEWDKRRDKENLLLKIPEKAILLLE